MEQPEVERIEEENQRLRNAAEQALFFVEEFRASLPVGDRFEVEALIATLNEALERLKD